jgi:hypothetical protein
MPRRGRMQVRGGSAGCGLLRRRVVAVKRVFSGSSLSLSPSQPPSDVFSPTTVSSSSSSSIILIPPSYPSRRAHGGEGTFSELSTPGIGYNQLGVMLDTLEGKDKFSAFPARPAKLRVHAREVTFVSRYEGIRRRRH